MSTLWTPGGEHPVDRSAPTETAPEPAAEAADAPELPDLDDLTPEEQAELEARMAAVQEELLRTPVEAVVANHAVGLFQLAALHLNQRPPNLEDGRLAIDALAGLTEAVASRLGEEGQAMTAALAQLRLAFVQLTDAARTATT